MKYTKVHPIDGTNYVVAALNFDQYQQHFFDETGEPLAHPKMGAAVRDSLANANDSSNPRFEDIPAKHVIDLTQAVMEVSGFKSAKDSASGEAAAEAPTA